MSESLMLTLGHVDAATHSNTTGHAASLPVDHAHTHNSSAPTRPLAPNATLPPTTRVPWCRTHYGRPIGRAVSIETLSPLSLYPYVLAQPHPMELSIVLSGRAYDTANRAIILIFRSIPGCSRSRTETLALDEVESTVLGDHASGVRYPHNVVPFVISGKAMSKLPHDLCGRCHLNESVFASAHEPPAIMTVKVSHGEPRFKGGQEATVHSYSLYSCESAVCLVNDIDWFWLWTPRSSQYIETTQGDHAVYAAFSLETHWTDVPASLKSGGQTTSTPCALSDFLLPPAHHSLPLSAPAMVRLWYRPCATPTNESVNSAMMDPLVHIHALPCRWPGDSVPDSITHGLWSHPLSIRLALAHIPVKSYPPDSPLPLATQQSFCPPFPPTAAVAGIDTASTGLRARCWQCGDERHG
ncbi:hypothetical protein K439DRAFT_1623464 [Ramaria rubella]|nr:hypothetical protein K439DRAFT_1623464 [Ramaria rubella]